jgi:hypothetical protein
MKERLMELHRNVGDPRLVRRSFSWPASTGAILVRLFLFWIFSFFKNTHDEEKCNGVKPCVRRSNFFGLTN